MAKVFMENATAIYAATGIITRLIPANLQKITIAPIISNLQWCDFIASQSVLIILSVIAPFPFQNRQRCHQVTAFRLWPS
jgi:hypothetical protein